MINQLPIWCRECQADYNNFDEEGMCTKCGAGNVMGRHTITVEITVDAYSYFDALNNVEDIIDNLIKMQVIPPQTTVL